MQSAFSPGKSKKNETLAETYTAMVAKGQIRDDPVQKTLVGKLDQLRGELDQKRLASKSSALGWLFGKSNKTNQSVRGLYIWGGVGRGKSFLMDMFFERVAYERKRRAHFNDFMADVHERVFRYRKQGSGKQEQGTDPISDVANEIADETRLLCFDEFTVTDIADAMILGRLFEQLFKRGVVLVATSNVRPDDLYKDGLNRGLFLPFVEILKANTNTFWLDADNDYRLEKLKQAPVYLTPINSESHQAMEEAWRLMTDFEAPQIVELELKGRKLVVPAAVKGVARFTFAELCEEPKGAVDFLALTKSFHTVFIDEIRVIKDSERNVAKRFILMIDTFYDNRLKLVVTAEAEPQKLYKGTWGTEKFEFERTVSRLVEMQSEAYLSETERVH